MLARSSTGRKEKKDEENITKAYLGLAAVLLRTVNPRKEGYAERLAWVSSDLCHAICDALETDYDDYRRVAVPEEYSQGFPGVQLEFNFS